MGSKITIIPKVSAIGIKTLNIKTGEVWYVNLDNILPEGEIIEITWNKGKENQKAKIWKEIETLLIERLDDLKNYGLSEYGLDNEAESEPIIIDIGDSEEYLAQNYGTTLKGDYRLIQIDNTKYTNTLPIKLDRIFLSAPPRLARNYCEFFQPDPNNLLKFDWEGKEKIASCGFQYFYQNFSKNSNRRKFVQVQKQREAKLPDKKTKAKSSFDKIKWYCENKHDAFDDWLLLFKNNLAKREIRDFDPVDNDVIRELVSEIPELSVLDLSTPEYSEFDKYNSMTIFDIVNICMWMNLNLEIYDDIDEMVLCYSKNHNYHDQHKIINREIKGKVMVKIIDNHGYFVKDGDPAKNSYSVESINKFGGFYPSQTEEIEIQVPSDTQDTIDTTDTSIIKHPRVEYFRDQSIYEWREGFECGVLPVNPTEEDFRKYKYQIEAPYLADNPPPTPDELISMMSGENTLYYTGNNCLNGLVSYLKRPKYKDCSIEWTPKDGKGYWKINKVEVEAGYTPDNLRGSTTSIKKATYGKLKIYTANSHPDIQYRPEELDGCLDSDDEEAEQNCINDWKEKYPQLKKFAVPPPSQIGQAVFDEFKLDCYSCFNSVMRDILFRCETKPYYRYTPPTHEDACAFSLDFSKAYSNALRFMDCKWSVFDAIDEPTKNFKFDENYFYLCKELETGFPYKDLKDKGYALYHGCLLRHLVGKVKPVYQLTCNKLLPPDTFNEFVEKCYELAGDGKNNIITAKQLVNQTLGNLKKKSGMKDYKLYLNNSRTQVQKHYFGGLPVYNIDKISWKNTNYLSARGNIQHHFMSGQPIRLQVMDRINELNLLLDTAVRKSLNRDIHLILEKTDALYYQYPDGAKYKHKDYYWNDFSFRPEKELDLDTINSELPDGYEVKLEHPVCWGGKPVEIDKSWNDLPRVINQGCINRVKSRWNKPFNKYDYKWDAKVEVPKILRYTIENDGLFISGEAGTGKTEIIKGIDNICKDNRSIHKFGWVRLFCKLLFGIKEGQKVINDWKTYNPCFLMKFAPTNKACNNIAGKTLHRGLGLKVINTDEVIEEEDEEKPKCVRDRVADIVKILEENNTPDIAIFDEVGMIGGDGWSLISYIKYRIPSIKIILCGDIERQLAPVGEEKRKFADSICIKELVNYNQINLEYNFRRSGGTNRLWEDWSINPQRFKVDDLPLTERNICRFNKTRKKVIDLVQDNHPDPVLWLDCNVGEDLKNIGCNNRLMIAYDTPLIARVSWKDRSVAKNEIWRVKDIGEEIVLKFKDKEESFTKEEICRCWLSAYCITIHKAQGDTYDDEYTIWDWEQLSKYRYGDNRRLRYVAQSRSTNPETLIRYK
jgi:hypothetical protein